MGVKINQSFYQKIDAVSEKVESEVGKKMFGIARTAVLASPVDTGAFVNSWSFKDNLGGGRSKSSRNKPKGVLDQPQKLTSLRNLAKDINVALSGDSKGGYRKAGIEVPVGDYYLINRAPHAEKVERKYKIKRRVRRQHG